MKIAVTGATGLVGQALLPALQAKGHEPIIISRHPPAGGVRWNPAQGNLDASTLSGCQAAIHLAGEPILGRWTKARRQAIRLSRTQGTRLLAESLARLKPAPKVLLSASAIGYYGISPEGEIDESAPAGKGFLADVCRAWEAATAPAEEAGIRVVHLRIGVVLSPHGGALAQLLPIFRAGGGGPIGAGQRRMSWIGLPDLVGSILHALETESLQGPLNLTSPHPVSNAAFSKALGEALQRPALLPVPPLALKLLYGQMATETLLSDAAIVPRRLTQSGYQFAHPELPEALKAVLDRTTI